MQYVRYLDRARIASILGVITLHASGFLLVLSKTGTYDYWIANLYHSFGSWSVPVFVMLSGALLLSRDYESISSFYAKRIKKVLLPSFFWVTIYYLAQLIIQGKSFELTLYFKIMVKMFDSNGMSAHLWFIPMIISLYIAAPFLRSMIVLLNPKIIKLFIVIWFIFSSILPCIDYFFNIKLSVDTTIFGPWAGYFVLGYYLHNYTKDIKIWHYIIIFIVAYCLTLYLSYSYCLTHTLSISKPNNFFHGYLSPNVIFMAIGVFIILKNIKIEFIQTRLLKTISNTIFGIFFIHILFLDPLMFANKGILNPVHYIGTTWGTMLNIMITFLFSFFAVLCIKRIKYLRFMAP